MRYNAKLDPGESFVLVCVLAALWACSGDLSQPVQPSGTPAVAFNDFNATTSLDAFSLPYKYQYEPGDLDFPNDPTGSGRGKVARFHYLKSSVAPPADVNRSITYIHKVGWGETMYFKGDVYCPISDFQAPLAGMARKFLYWQPAAQTLIDKYGASPSIYFIMGVSDGKWSLENGNSDQPLDWPFFGAPSGNTWYTIEVRLTMQSAPGVADGIVTMWIDGVQVYENAALNWVPSSWIGQPVPGGNGTPLEAADIYFEHFQIGDQINAGGVLYDEYRYWDNVGFSTKRIGN